MGVHHGLQCCVNELVEGEGGLGDWRGAVNAPYTFRYLSVSYGSPLVESGQACVYVCYHT